VLGGGDKGVSDFDEVLERLVTDPAFQTALATDPDSALRGYSLDDQEREVLYAQLSAGAGADRLVEDRISKSGLFGMVGPVISAMGFLATPDDGAGAPPGGRPPAGGLFGPARPIEGAGTLEVTPPDLVETTLDRGGASGLLEVAEPGQPGAGTPAVDYHTHVDADGDGRWNPHQAVESGDGGVDILVDRDGDGTVDWIAHDADRDGLIEDAVVDMDHDGVFETRFVDDTGDGWLDRRA
jgi:hypothetical protein